MYPFKEGYLPSLPAKIGEMCFCSKKIETLPPSTPAPHRRRKTPLWCLHWCSSLLVHQRWYRLNWAFKGGSPLQLHHKWWRLPGCKPTYPRSSKQVITYNLLNNHLPNLLAYPSINPKSLQGCFTPTKQLHSHKKGSPVLFTLHNFDNNSNSGQLWDSSGIFRNLSYSTCSFTNLLHQESELVAPLRCWWQNQRQPGKVMWASGQSWC